MTTHDALLPAGPEMAECSGGGPSGLQLIFQANERHSCKRSLRSVHEGILRWRNAPGNGGPT
jgi:hypothetical protein